MLSGQLEASVYRAVQIYGLDFFNRPIVLFLMGLIAVTAFAAWKLKSPDTEPTEGGVTEPETLAQRMPQLVFTGFLVLATSYVVITSFEVSFLARIFPLSVGALALVLTAIVFIGQITASKTSPHFADGELNNKSEKGQYYFFFWMLGFLALVALLGFVPAAVVFVFVFTTIYADRNWARNLTIAGTLALVLIAFVFWLGATYPHGLLQQFVPMPWWLIG